MFEVIAGTIALSVFGVVMSKHEQSDKWAKYDAKRNVEFPSGNPPLTRIQKIGKFFF